jgi:hypothetical protein
MQGIKARLVILFAAMTLALGGVGALAVTESATGNVETVAAHDYYTNPYCRDTRSYWYGAGTITWWTHNYQNGKHYPGTTYMSYNQWRYWCYLG